MWSGLAVFYVNVDPLFVASRLSKLVNALLCYFHPIAHPDFGANCGLDLVEIFKDPHSTMLRTATVDIKRFPRDEPRRIMCKKGGGHAHVFSCCVPAPLP